jgi:hypothetical protein
VLIAEINYDYIDKSMGASYSYPNQGASLLFL